MFKVISIEIGYPEDNPYHISDDKFECEIVCKMVAEKYNSRCFVSEKGRYIFMVDYSGYNKFKKGI